MKKLRRFLAGALAFSFQAHAGILFSDDFSATGSGTGFAKASTWEAGLVAGGGTAAVADNSLTVTSPLTGRGKTQVFRSLNSAITVKGADFWFVAKIIYSGTKPADAAWFGISFHEGGPSGKERLFFGSDSATTMWEFSTDGTDHTSAVPNFTASPTLLVAHITDKKIDLWIDPTDVSSSAKLGTADATFSKDPVTLATRFDTLRIGAGVGAYGFQFSETKIEDMVAATTFAEAIR